MLPEGKSKEEVAAEDQEEEEEAKNIQRRLAADLSEEDYDLNLLQVRISAHRSTAVHRTTDRGTGLPCTGPAWFW